MAISTQNGLYYYKGIPYTNLQDAKNAEMADSSMTIDTAIPAPAGIPTRQPMPDALKAIGDEYTKGIPSMGIQRPNVQPPMAPKGLMEGLNVGGRGSYAGPATPATPVSGINPAQPTPNQPQAPKPEMSFMDKLTSKQGIGAIGNAMLSMSQDPRLQAMGMQGLQQAQARKQANRTLDFLAKQGVDEETLAALRDNPQMINAYTSSLLKAPKTYAAQENYKLAKTQGYSGSFLDYQKEMALAGAGIAGDKDFWKEYRGDEAKAITELATQSPELKTALSQIQTLRLLGERMDESTIVPQFLRDSVPKGMSNSIDAYRSMLYGVAQSLRQAGTGPMTDKDFDILVQRAGSESLGLEERRAIQSGLEAAAKMRLDLSMAASEFRRNPSDDNLAKYREAEAEILNRPLFNDEQRKLLGVDNATISQQFPDAPEGFLKSLPPADIEIFKKMPAEDKAQAIEEWRRKQTGR